MVDFLTPLMDVPFYLITYKHEELAGEPLNVFRLVTGKFFDKFLISF